jgi:hypothetical protein
MLITKQGLNLPEILLLNEEKLSLDSLVDDVYTSRNFFGPYHFARNIAWQ